MRTSIRLIAPILLAIVPPLGLAALPDLDQEVNAIIRDHDSANYGTTDSKAKAKAFEAVAKRAADLAKQYPNRAEPLVWQGQSQASQGAAERSLGLIKQARNTLEAAIAITPNAYVVENYATLGSLYGDAPGFPLSFGDKKKARDFYLKALAVNASNIDANLGYAKLLLKTDDFAGAVKFATVALNVPARPGREKADQAAQADAKKVIAQANSKLR